MRKTMNVQIEQAVTHYVQLDAEDKEEASKVKGEFWGSLYFRIKIY